MNKKCIVEDYSFRNTPLNTAYKKDARCFEEGYNYCN